MEKILIIEDEKNIILPLKMFLLKLGYDVKIATDGIEGIRIAQEIIPNIILLDIILPKMNGYLVCKALKDESETKNIPIIFMSAKTQEKDIKKAYDVGGEDYIIKPFIHKDIEKILNKYLKED
ncbi:response regulator transcription factor [Senegalia massiliensis]|jgi:DNA-binding response OmpR family regulator|uniref:response regulator transcription factor n=1 Tax=Senegalia massiliensis TaxID=1720316 RepID=UPI001030AAAF|nr:response regulator [Senegalia massiliensis]